MATLALSPVNLAGGLSALSVTANLQALASYTGVTFVNDGQVFLLISNGATPGTATVTIATTVEGQAVTSPSAYTIAATTVYTIGRFDPGFSAGLGGIVTVTLGTPTTMSAVLLR